MAKTTRQQQTTADDSANLTRTALFGGKSASFLSKVKQTTGSTVIYDLYVKTLEFVGDRYAPDSEQLYNVAQVVTENLKSLLSAVAEEDKRGIRDLEEFKDQVEEARVDAVGAIIKASGRFGVTVDLIRQILGAQFSNESRVFSLVKEEADRLVNVGEAVHPHGMKRYFAKEHEAEAAKFFDRFSSFLSMNNRQRAKKEAEAEE